MLLRCVTTFDAAPTILCMSELFSFNYLPAIGFAIGIIIGLTGVGGGSLMTPILVGGLGIPPAIAVGTDLLFASITKSFGAVAHWRVGNVAKRLLWVLIGSSLTGAAKFQQPRTKQQRKGRDEQRNAQRGFNDLV